MSDMGKRAWDVAGWFGAAAASVAVPGIVGWLTGSFGTVAEFASEHPTESALWSVAFTGLGMLVGLAIRSAIATRQLREKDAEMEKAVERATKPLHEQIDRLMNRENFALMRMRGLSLKELGIVKKFMTQGGEVYLKVDDASVRHLADSGFIHINNETYCPPDMYPFTLDDSVRSLLIEFPDTLDKAISEAKSVKSRYKGE